MIKRIFTLAILSFFTLNGAMAQVNYDSLLSIKSLAFSYPDSAKQLAQRILALEAEDSITANTLSLIGVIHRLQGEFNAGIEYADSAITYGIEEVNASAFLNKAVCLRYMGEYEESTSLALAAVEIYERLGQLDQAATAYNNLGVISMYLEDYEAALDYYRKSYNMHVGFDNLKGQSEALNNIAIVYANQGDLESSEVNFRKSLVIEQRLNNRRGQSESLFNIGSVKQYKGDYDSALIYIEQSLKIDKEFGDPQAIAAVFNNLGEIAMEGAQYQKAKMYLDSSLYYSKASKSIHDIENAYYNLFKMYELQSEFEKALDHHINYVACRDSIFNTERVAAVSELQTKYETEKKEQQIALQEAQIAEQQAQLELNLIFIIALIIVVALIVAVALLNRSRAKKQQELLLREAQLQLKEAQIESAIASQEQERKRFARDLHDGFGQFISVLNLNLKSLEKGAKDPEQIFESSAEVLDQMYRELKGICFNLMPETLIKQGIVNGIKEFSDRINVAGKVSIEVDTFEMGERLEDLQEISLYRITQEWVNNILKYSDATRINIQLTRDESEITLMIEDDGMGFDKSLLTSSKGNGWKNLNSRANLIKGELDLDTTVGIKGSALILNCPVRQPQELLA